MTVEDRNRRCCFLALLCAACTTSGPAPTRYQLANWRVSYRDYAESQLAVCEAEPTWLFDELTAVSELLNDFLDKSPAHGASWSVTQEEFDQAFTVYRAHFLETLRRLDPKAAARIEQSEDWQWHPRKPAE